MTLDHAIATAGNFGFLLLAGRELPAADYGLIGVFLAGYFLAMGSLRAVSSDLFIPSVRSGVVRGEAARGLLGRAVTGSAGTALVFGAAVAGYVAVAGALSLATAVWLLVGLVALLLGDTMRAVTLALHRLGWTLVYDTVWTVGTLGTLVVLMVRGTTDVAAWWLAYALWSGLAGVALLLPAQVRRVVAGCRLGWGRYETRVKAGFLADFLLGVGAAQALLLVAAVYVSLGELGSYRLVLSELGLLNFLAATGHTALTVSSSHRVLADPRSGLRTVGLAAAVLGGVLTAYAVLLAALPEAALTAVFGPNADASSALFVLVAVQSVVAVLTVPANFVLKTRRQVPALLTGRAVGLPGLVLGGVLAVGYGVVGLAVGVLVASALTAAALWWSVVRAAKSRPERPLAL
ncbi:hypothetical protein [Blastococcus sp. SYSU DS0533]